MATPRPMRGDNAAILEFPFRLIVAMVSLALVVPAVMGGWSSVDYMQTEQRIRAEVSRVLSAAQRYLQAGSGGETLEVSLRDGAFTHVEYVVFGDVLGGAYSHATRYKLSGGQEKLMIAKNPSVILSSPSHSAVKLPEGTYSLHIECIDGASIIVWTV